MSTRQARWLARRLITRQPGQAVLIGLVCLIAVGAGVVAHHGALAERDQLETDATRRYGYVSVTVDGAAARGSRVAHLPDRGFSPIPDELVSSVRVAAERLGLRVHGRFEGAVYDSGERRVRPLIAVGPDDPARLAEDGSRFDERRFAVAIDRYGAGVAGRQRVEWHEIPPAMIAGMTTDGSLVVEGEWMDTVLRAGYDRPDGSSLVVNVLVSDPPRIRDASPFAAAFELAERLATLDAAVQVVAWPETIGYGRYAAATGADLLRPILLLVAAVATGGATSVAVRNRTRDIGLLRTMGFGGGFIRRVFVRESGLASVGASALILVGLLAASQAGASVVIDGPVRRTLAFGAALPPVVSFLVLRARLRAPLRRERSEW